MEFCRIPLNSTDPAPKNSWRGIHIGGDDHVMRGPTEYLKNHVRNHLKFGSQFSYYKHGISSNYGMYTEKLLYVKNLSHRLRRWEGDSNIDASPIVDSIKVRLLEKGQSTELKKDDRNVAFGKAFQLMNHLKWIHNRRLANNVRDLFIKRMRSLLPNKDDHPKLWHMMFLPKQIGGLSLGFDDEIEFHFNRSPYPIQCILTKMMWGMDVREEGRILRKLTTNPSQRGIPWLQDKEEALQRYLEGDSEEGSELLNFSVKPSLMSWKDLLDRYDPEGKLGNVQVTQLAAKDGIHSHHKWIQRFLRGSIFQNLLCGKPNKRSNFDTVPYVDRYVKCKSRLLEETEIFGLPEYNPGTFSEIFEKYKLDKMVFVDESQPILVEKEHKFPDENGDLVVAFKDSWEAPLSEVMFLNQPSLVVGEYD
jgi:hypothetical protein